MVYKLLVHVNQIIEDYLKAVGADQWDAVGEQGDWRTDYRVWGESVAIEASVLLKYLGTFGEIGPIGVSLICLCKRLNICWHITFTLRRSACLRQTSCWTVTKKDFLQHFKGKSM